LAITLKGIMYKICVFDFDGTIVDTMPNLTKTAVEVLTKYYSVLDKEAEEGFINTSGIPFFQQIELLFPDDPRNKEASEEYEREKLKGFFEESVFPDTQEIFSYLKRKNYLITLSSSNFQEVVDKYLKIKGIKVDLALGAKENFYKGEDHFNFIKDKYNLRKEEMVFVGDSLKDGERAIDFGVDFIGKRGIFSVEAFNQRFPGVKVINELLELKEML